MWQFVVYLSPTSQEIQLFMYNTEFEVQPARSVLGSSISADTLVIVYPGKKRSYRASVSKLVPCEDVDTFSKGHAWLPPQLVPRDPSAQCYLAVQMAEHWQVRYKSRHQFSFDTFPVFHCDTWSS